MSLTFFKLLLACVLGMIPLISYSLCPNCTCVLSATPVNFGDNYNPLTGNINETFGSITATCTSLNSITNASITLAINPGINSNFNPRLLESGTNNLDYNLYTDATFTQVWGDGTGGTNTVTFQSCTSIEHIAPYSCSHTFPVYGKIPASQLSVMGNVLYLNTLIATLSY